MSAHQRHTDFLKNCLHFADHPERHHRGQTIDQIQRDLQCVRTATWMMAVLLGMVLVSLAYGTVLVENFTYNTSKVVINIISAAGLTALISLPTLWGLKIFYRRKLDKQHEECRQLITRALESRLGDPDDDAPPRDPRRIVLPQEKTEPAK